MVIPRFISNSEIYQYIIVIATIHLNKYLLSKKSFNPYKHSKRVSNLFKGLELASDGGRLLTQALRLWSQLSNNCYIASIFVVLKELTVYIKEQIP